MHGLMRRLVRLIRIRRRAALAERIRAYEAGLGLVEPALTELHADPDLLTPPRTRRRRREWERHRRGMLGQRSPKGE